MGAYLSEPKLDKDSADGGTARLSYGVSAMQGWRISMEDAHNCIPEFDEKTALFAVYDGHGGAEVAEYCAKYLPDHLQQLQLYNYDKDRNLTMFRAEVAEYCAKYLPDHLQQLQLYKEGNLRDALQEGFLSFDVALFHTYSSYTVFSYHTSGAEVAEYCAKYLPDHLQQLQLYKEGNLRDALQEGFLSFDERLTQEEVINELKQLAGLSEDEQNEQETTDDPEDEASLLKQEADMSIEEILARYGKAQNKA
ncbi:Protein phosphatase 1G [Branchiostoma belcheri]|nr:Protein phosphatase 1G [Branchiostoma belcheri]